MIPKIAVINDLSGFGRCSLTAAISVLSVMGVQACPLPTAVLTAQTGYPSYYCDNYTDRMDHFTLEWQKMDAHFDGIYTGYIADERQIEKIFSFLDIFYHNDNFLLVDPIMGDDGAPYSMYTDTLLAKMKTLVTKADFATPNLTELCLLTDCDYKDLPDGNSPQQLFAAINQLGKTLCAKGTKAIIVTGIHFTNPQNAKKEIGNLYITANEDHAFSFPDLGGSYSGTGDLFASVLTGGIARGDRLDRTITLAGSFLQEALQDSVETKVPTTDGVNYEKYLSLLLPTL